MGLQAYLTLAAVVFCIGLFGVITRRNTIGILLGIELMLNSVNINLVAFDVLLRGAEPIGQIFALFVITIAAAEIGIGLAIVILIYRMRDTLSINEVSLMKW
jgi:NADH:ubiquinone oxidoreductase subunit K